MKKRIILIAFLSISGLVIYQSDVSHEWRKKWYLYRFGDFIETVENESSQMKTIVDWKAMDKKFQEFAFQERAKYKNALNQQERTYINQLIGKYYALKTKFYGRKAKEGVRNLFEEGTGFLRELLE